MAGRRDRKARETDVERRIRQIRSLLRATAGVFAVEHRVGKKPVAVSPAAADLESDLAWPAVAANREHPARMCLSIGDALAFAAEHHLTAIDQLLRPQMRTALSALAVARLCLEASAQAWWIFEPDITTRDRLARAYGIRMKGLSGRVTVLRHIPGVAEAALADAEERRGSALVEAVVLRLPVHRQDGVVTGLNLPPNGSDTLIAGLLGDVGYKGGGALHHYLSTYVHSFPQALMNLGGPPTQVDTTATIDFQVGLGRSVEDVEMAGLVPIAGAIAMGRRCHSYFGLDPEPWETIERRIDALTRAI